MTSDMLRNLAKPCETLRSYDFCDIPHITCFASRSLQSQHRNLTNLMTQDAVPCSQCLNSIPFDLTDISGRHRNKIPAASCRYPASWQPHVLLFAMVRLILCSHYVYYAI